MRSRLLGLIGLLLGTTVALLWAAPGASAHASLVASNPTEGQRLDALPASVSFEFSEEMSEPAYVVVTGPDGSSVTSGDPEVQGAIVSQALDGSQAAGTYTMAYRAVSADGHPVTGQITFTVGDGGDGGGGADAPGDSPSPSPTASSSAPVASAAPAPAADAGGDDEGFWERRGLQVGGAGLLLLAGGGAWLVSRRTS
ncbi:copper resistance CopC family protein [Nocardioides fonticola]|uniref:copper resistance CopC family protein n=1 Tax=Nocardioides fonticola TaxID=450363 RepID=UPI0031CF272D